MAYIEIDVDLDDFEIEDLAEALMLKLKSYKRKLNESTKMKLKQDLEELMEQFDVLPTVETYNIVTIVDELKHKVLVELYNTKSLEELEELKNK